MLVDAIQVKEPDSVRTESGVLRLKPGDWLMRDAYGNLTRCDDINFKCSYEPLGSHNELEQLVEGKPCGC